MSRGLAMVVGEMRRMTIFPDDWLALPWIAALLLVATLLSPQLPAL